MPGLQPRVTDHVPRRTGNGRQIVESPRISGPVHYGAGEGHLVLCKPGRLCYTLPAREHLFRLFLGSSAVEHSTVNRMVAGSNPARGATTVLSRTSANNPNKP